MKNSFFKLGLILIFALSLCFVSCPGTNEDGPTPSDDYSDVVPPYEEDPSDEDSEPEIIDDNIGIFKDSPAGTVFVYTVKINWENDSAPSGKEDYSIPVFVKKNEKNKICFEGECYNGYEGFRSSKSENWILKADGKNVATSETARENFITGDCCGNEIENKSSISFELVITSGGLMGVGGTNYNAEFVLSIESDEGWSVYTPTAAE